MTSDQFLTYLFCLWEGYLEELTAKWGPLHLYEGRNQSLFWKTQKHFFRKLNVITVMTPTNPSKRNYQFPVLFIPLFLSNSYTWFNAETQFAKSYCNLKLWRYKAVANCLASTILAAQVNHHTTANKPVTQMLAPLAACCGPVGNQNRTAKVLYVFKHKT